MKEDSRSEQFLSKALARQQQTLDEFDSKRFLSCFGIPVTDQSFTQDAVAAEAERMGLPVVLKACGTSLTHKTEAGGGVFRHGKREGG